MDPEFRRQLQKQTREIIRLRSIQGLLPDQLPQPYSIPPESAEAVPKARKPRRVAEEPIVEAAAPPTKARRQPSEHALLVKELMQKEKLTLGQASKMAKTILKGA